VPQKLECVKHYVIHQVNLYQCVKHYVVHQVNLYRGFLAICHPDDPHLSVVDRYVELSSGLCMREWRRLPHIVSHIHLPLLQAAQQVGLLRHVIILSRGFGSPGLYEVKVMYWLDGILVW
jgi:transformation/transcription domain-associated protein